MPRNTPSGLTSPATHLPALNRRLTVLCLDAVSCSYDSSHTELTSRACFHSVSACTPERRERWLPRGASRHPARKSRGSIRAWERSAVALVNGGLCSLAADERPVWFCPASPPGTAPFRRPSACAAEAPPGRASSRGRARTRATCQTARPDLADVLAWMRAWLSRAGSPRTAPWLSS